MIAVASLAVSVLAVLGGRDTSAQDTAQAKYAVRVPNGLAFSEFRGYEGWQTVSISRNEKLMAVILANPVMINAYQSGIPGNGTPFPDGSKMAKIHWNSKKNGIRRSGRCSRRRSGRWRKGGLMRRRRMILSLVVPLAAEAPPASRVRA